jgi:hypothetical protein
MSGHPVIERQVAALHRAIAELIRAGDALPVRRALDNLERWRAAFGGELPYAYQEWEQVLRLADIAQIVSILIGDNEDAVRRRSSSPFTGILSPRERLEIMRRAA